MANGLPDVTFADSTPLTIADRFRALYETIRRVAEPDFTLGASDPERLVQLTESAMFSQAYTLLNDTGRGNLLYYARGAQLDHLGAFLGERGKRLPPAYAHVTLEYTLSTPLPTITTLPAGLKATPDNQIFFQTEYPLEIPAGQRTGQVRAVATVQGREANGFSEGTIRNMVDIPPFVSGVANVTVSDGGTDWEDDGEVGNLDEANGYRGRLHMLIESYSVAGPDGAYEFWARSANADIADARAWMPPLNLAAFGAWLTSELGVTKDDAELAKLWESLNDTFRTSGTGPGNVNIAVLMRGGEPASTEVLNDVMYILDDKVPLTDYVHPVAPVIITYDIDFQYWINRSDALRSAQIQAAVTAAVTEYTIWQASKIGRDITPLDLWRRVGEAGAKRIIPVAPVFTVLEAWELAKPGSVNPLYMGLEDD